MKRSNYFYMIRFAKQISPLCCFKTCVTFFLLCIKYIFEEFLSVFLFTQWKFHCCFEPQFNLSPLERVLKRVFRFNRYRCECESRNIWLFVVHIASVWKWNIQSVSLKDYCSLMFENNAPSTLDLTDSFNKTNCEIKTHWLQQPC